MRTVVLVIVTALFAWNVQMAEAQKPAVVLSDDAGWQKIGETVASFKEQDESIVVWGADEFSSIKIKVEDAPLQIERLQIFYESGEMEEVDVKKKIDAGGESDVIRLKHPDRDIQKVAFTYHTVANTAGDKAGVELFGMKPAENRRSSDAYRDDADRGRDAVERSADDIDRQAEETESDIERESDEAKKDIDRRADKTGRDLKNASEETGDAISEAAGKVGAEIDDRRHDTKVGPDGQTIYIGDDSRYYYINEEGKRVYVSGWQLKDKPRKD